jgi:phytol kinase
MIAPWLGIVAAVVALGLWFAIGNFLAKLPAVSDELARKFVHVAMGLTCLSFPWVFSEAWPVFVLGGIALIGLLIMKRSAAGACLHGVERCSLGEVYFTLGIAVLFWWSKGDPLTFCVPTLILTIADAAGALVGSRYGKTSLTAHKSAEGSAIFFLAAFMSAHVPLVIFSDIGRVEVLVISLTLATMVMLVEAISIGGLDNFLIPIGGYYLLSEYMKMDIGTLVGRFVLVVFLLLLVLTLRKRSSLDGAALLGATLFAYGCYALGGWACFITPMIVFFAHLHATKQIAEKIDEAHTLSAILSIGVTGLIWLVFRREDPLAGFTLGLAVHFGILSYNTLAFLQPELSGRLVLLRSSVKAVLLCYAPLVLFFPGLIPQAGVAFVLSLAATFVFSRIYPARPKVSGTPARWVTECAIATAASGAALMLA